MSTPNPPPGVQPAPAARAQTLALQGLVNRIVRGLLRTPLLCRLVGKRLITVYVVGRKSGRRYAVPVAYTRHNGTLLIGTPFAWARNLRTGEPVQIRLAGQRRSADVQVLTDETGVVEHYALMARDNHQFARFNKIGFDQRGNPRPGDLHLAWAAGARVALLTPR
jgi:deazaflavin-dependent oxidoreductase (nitroreductase family)